jgi:hypothetical protein
MKHFMLNLVELFKNFSKYGMVGDYVVIDASSYCQLNCKLCPRDLYVKRAGLGYLRFADFKKFIDLHPGIKNIDLSHTGELFLNPELLDIIKYAYLKHVNLIANNGVNFNNVSDKTLECLVKFKFKAIRIAIDGATNETYTKYRSGGDFNRVINNINKLNYFKNKYNSIFPHLVWAFIIFGHNEHEIPLAKKMAKELNMTFLPIFNVHPSFSPVRNKDYVAREIGLKSVKEYEYRSNLAYSNICMQLWYGPYINWDGRLLGCCINEWGDYGNVFKDGLAKCVKTKKYVNAKKSLLGKIKAQNNIPCFHCDKYKKLALNNSNSSEINKLRASKLPFIILERQIFFQFIFNKGKRIIDCIRGIQIYLFNSIKTIIMRARNFEAFIYFYLFKNRIIKHSFWKILCVAYFLITSLKKAFLIILRREVLQIREKISIIFKANRREIDKNVKLIAFYLPQFHSIPENDEWWGKGFTEWTKVRQAKPLFNNIFKKHYQPREPSAEIGYYNLLNVDVQRKQIKMAKEYGIYGFCFYHYWFNGKKLLEKPVETFIVNKDLDFPFCLCWANEPWTRKWDGLDQHVLQAQTYGGEQDWVDHFNYLLPALNDKRAIRIDGKPIFLIYRIGHIECINEMINCWRKQAKSYGLPGLIILAGITAFPDSLDFYDKDIDGVYEFAPNCLTWENPEKKWNALYKYDLYQKYDYDSYWQALLKCEKRFHTHFRGAFVSWDNTPRAAENAIMVYGATPDKYRIYLRNQIQRVLKESGKDKFIFINAWNEWAEGCYLEPDKKYGRAFLEATKKALTK